MRLDNCEYDWTAGSFLKGSHRRRRCDCEASGIMAATLHRLGNFVRRIPVVQNTGENFEFSEHRTENYVA